ncbi:MAG: hypothetical protein H6737_12615 [Alphaproteobacteria bacterium]|nr:hypothetical protein [Alphaproteobacteria bacterium]
MESSDAVLLRDAVAQLREGRLSEALVSLLRLWEASRDPDVARAIERLDPPLREVRPALDAEGTRAQKAWMLREGDAHPADVRALVETLRAGEPGRARLNERIQRLLERPPDPRLFAAVMQRVQKLPYHDVAPAYEKLLLRHADPRAAGQLSVSSDSSIRKALVAEWTKRLVRVEKALAGMAVRAVPGADALTSEVSSALKTPRDHWLDVTPPTSDAVLDDLWDGVLADPSDDAARLVFADRVAETDPDHAVFIHRQLADEAEPLPEKEQKKLAKLVKQRMSDWLGPLSGRVNTTGAVFRRGFLDAGMVITASEAEARELGDLPHWRTASALWAKHTSFFEGAGVSALACAGSKFAWDPQLGRWIPNAGQAMSGGQVRKLVRMGRQPWRALQVQASDSHVDLLEVDLPKLDAPDLETLVLSAWRIDQRLVAALPPVREIVYPGEAADPTWFLAMPSVERVTMSGIVDLRRRLDDRWSVEFLVPTKTERLHSPRLMRLGDRDALKNRIRAALAKHRRGTLLED